MEPREHYRSIKVWEGGLRINTVTRAIDALAILTHWHCLHQKSVENERTVSSNDCIHHGRRILSPVRGSLSQLYLPHRYHLHVDIARASTKSIPSYMPSTYRLFQPSRPTASLHRRPSSPSTNPDQPSPSKNTCYRQNVLSLSLQNTLKSLE